MQRYRSIFKESYGDSITYKLLKDLYFTKTESEGVGSGALSIKEKEVLIKAGTIVQYFPASKDNYFLIDGNRYTLDDSKYSSKFMVGRGKNKYWKSTSNFDKYFKEV